VIAKIQADLPNLEEGAEEADQIKQHFNNTLNRLRDRLEITDTDGPNYQGLVLEV